MKTGIKSLLLPLVVLFVNTSSFAQVDREQIADSIFKEGKKLYESEMTSWYGTDVFFEKFKEEAENIGGYFSYKDGDTYKCVFYSRTEKPTVLGTISFKKSFDPKKAESDGNKRAFTEKEIQYYAIKKAASEEIETDTVLFQRYQNTNFNLIPLIEQNQNKVYVLTATSQTGIVIIGNDYLLTFDKTNKPVTKEKIHANLITMSTRVDEKKADGSEIMGSIHNHVPETGEFMTATDVCTFMLYEKISNWKQQLVISKNYMSIWNCKTDYLLIIPTN
jgi:hypothetical protein